MPKIIRNEIEYSSTTSTANQISYLNTTSGLSATNVQGAIDEVVDDLNDKADRVPEPAEYDPTATYTTGDFCTHEGDIYQATNTTTGTWNSNVWTLCTPQQDYLHSINPAGSGSFSLNRKASTTIGVCSFAEGSDVTASGDASHAEGGRTISSAVFSHAEGFSTTASGGWGSHAEGSCTTAGGYYSHAEGYYTRANHASQHVFGEYNVVDPSTASASDRGNYVEIVGNGTYYNARSNARTLDWDGNEVLSGGLTAKSCSIQNSSGTQTIGLDGSTGDVTATTFNGYNFTNVLTATMNTDYCTSNAVFYLQLGNVVFVSGRFTIHTQKPAGQAYALFTGFPVPKQYVICPVFDGGFSNTLIINANGDLTSNSAIPTGNVNIMAVYVT